MTGALEFVLNMQGLTQGFQQSAATSVKSIDAVTDAVSKTQRQVDATAAAVERMANAMGRHLQENVREVETLQRKLKELEKTGGYSIGRGGGISKSGGGGMQWHTGVTRSSGSRMARLSDAMSQLDGGGGGWMGTAAAAGLAGVGVGQVLRATMEAERDITGLVTFVGKERAQGIYKKLQADAVATPFDTRSLLEVDRALISAGVDADKARLDMLGLANAISATGGGNEELARMATNMQQIRNSGKATAEDIKQFAYSGINIYQLLSDATGKSADQVKKMVVSYDLLSFALRKARAEGGLYAGAMERQGETIAGKWSTLTDSINISMAKIGLAQAPAISGLIDTLTELSNRLPDIAERYSPAITHLVNEGLIPLVHWLIDASKWIYHNWGWLKYLAAGAVALRLAFVGLNAVVGAYNTLMALGAARNALFASTETAAAAAIARTVPATAWATTATAGYSIAVNAATSSVASLGTTSATVFSGMSAGALAATGAIAALGAAVVIGSLKMSNPGKSGLGKDADLYGSGYQLPFQSGYFKKDSTNLQWVEERNFFGKTGKGRYTAVPRWVDTSRSMAPWLSLGMTQEQYARQFPQKSGWDTATQSEPKVQDQLKGLFDKIEEKAGGITGGGGKTINISFKNFIEHLSIKPQTLKEGFDTAETDLKAMMARLLAGVPG